jgi:ribosomal protein L9
MSRLRFEIQGDPNSISLLVYSSATARVVQILRELDVAISGEGGASLNWYVSDLSKNGSLSMEVESRLKPPAKSRKRPRPDVSNPVAESFVTTFENIQDRGISPPYLSEYGLEKLQAMMALLHANGARGFIASAIEPQHRSVSVNENAARTLRQLLPPIKQLEGSVEGRLETISIHTRKKFIIYHAITHKAVTCTIETDEDLELAKRALGHKIVAFGLISINVKNEPLQVNVKSIRILGDGKRLPLAHELTGSDPDFTGDLSTDDYIRSIRRG